MAPARLELPPVAAAKVERPPGRTTPPVKQTLRAEFRARPPADSYLQPAAPWHRGLQRSFLSELTTARANLLE
jgi:hypothetical protein